MDIFMPGYSVSVSICSRTSSLGSTRQILTVWSAEQVARNLISGERRRRVRYSLWALKTRQGAREVSLFSWYMRQMYTSPWLFPAARSEPSFATLTLDTETSSAGMSWCVHLSDPRSKTRTFPPLSALTISPWFGCITTSFTG